MAARRGGWGRAGGLLGAGLHGAVHGYSLRTRVALSAAMVLGAVVALLLALLLLALLGAGSAHADAFGELGQVGKFGQGAGEFTYPTGLAVDQEDNSVFVVDEPEGKYPGVGVSSFRLQKLSAALALEGSAKVPTPSLGEEEKEFVAGVAVDPSRHLVYILKANTTGRSGPERYAAAEIDAYSTEPEAGVEKKLPLESVYFTFEKVSASGPLPPHAVLSPHGLTVEPETHALVVLSEASGSPTVLWRIAGEPTGTLAETETYADGGAVEGNDSSVEGPTGIAAGPHDELYLVGIDIGGPDQHGVMKLLTSVHGLAHPELELVHGEGPTGDYLTGGDVGARRGFGPQVAVSSDGSVVYAAQVSAEQGVNASNEPTAGSFEIRGMSTSNGSPRVVYGGGSSLTECHIASLYNAVAAGKEGVVYALDEGEAYENKSGEEVPTSFGFDLVKFGPGGHGCPAPALSFTISPSMKVEKGELVKFTASEAELRGAKLMELTWNASGPAPWEEKKAAPSGIEVEHRFLKPGTYSMELGATVEGASAFGPPPPVTQAFEVTAPPPTASFEVLTPTPKPGETITFNGGNSFDPKGLCSEASGCTSISGSEHGLEKYTWTSGDGTKAETTEPTYSRSFSNSGSQARSETVELVVTNKEGVQSMPFIERLTIQGTPETQPGGGGGANGVNTVTTTTLPPQVPPVVTPPPAPAVKHLTNAQKLSKALKACRKLKSRGRRASCERQAKARYAKHKKKKKK